MSAPENPPAFPSDNSYEGPDGYRRAKPQYELGMTLRDWFAGQALAGIVANALGKTDGYVAGFAFGAYEIADAMLAERAKVQS